MNQSRGRPFESGNKLGRGRPRGSRNKRTLALDALLNEHGESLTKKCIVSALQGDRMALRLCMDRLLPARKQMPMLTKLPSTDTADGVGRAFDLVIHGVGRGQLLPGEGEVLAGILDLRRRALETQELETRLRALELAKAEQR